MTLPTPDGSRWTFLTNHGHVLLCLVQEPELRLRDIAERVGVTERAVQGIVADLEAGGYLTRHRSGRQNVYSINADQPMRHPVEQHRTVRALIDLMRPRPRYRTSRQAGSASRTRRA